MWNYICRQNCIFSALFSTCLHRYAHIYKHIHTGTHTHIHIVYMDSNNSGNIRTSNCKRRLKIIEALYIKRFKPNLILTVTKNGHDVLAVFWRLTNIELLNSHACWLRITNFIQYKLEHKHRIKNSRRTAKPLKSVYRLYENAWESDYYG